MKITVHFILALVCLPCAAADGGFPDTFGLDPGVSYSATRILQAGDETLTQLERRAPGKLRLDSCPEAQACTYIIRADLDQSYTIGEGGYVRGGYPGPYDPRRETFRIAESEAVAEETIDGAPAMKYRATFSLAHGNVGAGHYWVHRGIMIRVSVVYTGSDGSDQRIVMALEDLVIGPQDPATFELPAGLTDFTNNI